MADDRQCKDGWMCFQITIARAGCDVSRRVCHVLTTPYAWQSDRIGVGPCVDCIGIDWPCIWWELSFLEGLLLNFQWLSGLAPCIYLRIAFIWIVTRWRVRVAYFALRIPRMPVFGEYLRYSRSRLWLAKGGCIIDSLAGLALDGCFRGCQCLSIRKHKVGYY